MISHPDLKRNTPETSKEKLFRLFHLLLYQYRVSPKLFSFFLLIQTVQIIYLPFHVSCCEIWSMQWINVVKKILGYANGSFIWASFGINSAITISAILLSLYLIASSIIIYQVRNIKPDTLAITNNLQQIRVKYLQYLSVLSRTILVIPTFSLLVFSFMECKNSFSTLSLFCLIISTTSAILFTLLTYLYLELLIDNSPFSYFSLAGPISLKGKYKLCVKMVIGAVVTLLPNQCNSSQESYILHLVFVIILTLAFAYLAFLNFSQANIVNNLNRRVSQHTTILLISVCLMSVIQKTGMYGQVISLIWTPLICFMASLVWSKAKEYRQKTLIFTIYKSITSKTDILAYNYLIFEHIRDFPQNPLNLVKLDGILTDHILNCNKLEEVCPCRRLREKIQVFGYEKNTVSDKKQMKLWFQFFKMNLMYSMEKTNHDPEIHLLLASIEENILQNIFLCYTNIQKCHRKDKIGVQFLLYNQKRRIQKKLKEEDASNNEIKQIDVNGYIQLSQSIERLNQKILKSSLEHINFWQQLIKINKKVNKNVVTKEGRKLLQTIKECEEIYNSISTKFVNNLQSIILFSNFSKYILNNNELMNKNKNICNMIRKKLRRSIKITMQHEKQKYDQNSNTGIIIISGQRSNVGIIKLCSNKVTKILKYSPYQLIGQNINLLMPSFLGNMHNQVLFKYLEKAQPQSNFKERYVPMIDKNNFMILTRIMTKPNPSLLNGLQIYGIFEKIKEHKSKHLNEAPKYLLYRCDTGNVQALSENFYTSYGYRLMKVSQYTQNSQQLNFNQLFGTVRDCDIKQNNDEGIDCQIKVRKSNKKVLKVKVYVRLQIMYFCTKIKLLQFFNNVENNNLMIQNALTINPTALSDKSSQQENVNTPVSEQVIKNQSEGLHQSELKQLQNRKPVKFKIFSICLLIFALSNITIAAVQIYFNLEEIQLAKKFIEHNQYIHNSTIQLINIGYYLRMLHLSANEDTLRPNFYFYRSNVQKLTDNLQKTQFWISNKEPQLLIDSTFQLPTSKLWEISQKQAISSKQSSLRLSIFNLIISSSSFKQILKQSLVFPYNLLFNPTLGNNTKNQVFRNYFNVRYSTLFELIPKKQQYQQKILQFYRKKMMTYFSTNYIELGVIFALIFVFCICLMKILYDLIGSIFMISTMFNWLTSSEIDKQIYKCEIFLQHFFAHSYEVILRFKKNQILKGYSFQETEVMNNFKTTHIKFMRTNPLGEENERRDEGDVSSKKLCLPLHKVSDKNMNFSNLLGLPSEDRDKNSISDQLKNNKSDFINETENFKQDEIDIVKISEKNINKEKAVNVLVDEETPLNKEDQSQRFSDQNDEKIDKGSYLVLLPIFVLVYLMLMHFMGMFIYSKGILETNSKVLQDHNLLIDNLRVLDSLKYYSLETLLDNEKFFQYQSLDKIQAAFIEKSYLFQQKLNELSDQSHPIYKIQQLLNERNLGGVCDESNYIDTLVNKKSELMKSQCKIVDRGILSQGLRASIVAFIETNRQLTISSNLTESLNSQQFIKVPLLYKYITSSLNYVLNENKISISEQFQFEKKVIIAWSIIFMIWVIFINCLINYKTIRLLSMRISGTYQIISLIPKRIFEKNENLCNSYRKQVAELLK